jgi:hypothetical protein
MRERDFLFLLRPFLRRVFPVAVFFLKIIVHFSTKPHWDSELQNRTVASDVATLNSPLNDAYSSLAPMQNFRIIEGNALRQMEQKLKFL